MEQSLKASFMAHPLKVISGSLSNMHARFTTLQHPKPTNKRSILILSSLPCWLWAKMSSRLVAWIPIWQQAMRKRTVSIMSWAFNAKTSLMQWSIYSIQDWYRHQWKARDQRAWITSMESRSSCCWWRVTWIIGRTDFDCGWFMGSICCQWEALWLDNRFWWRVIYNTLGSISTWL